MTERLNYLTKGQLVKHKRYTNIKGKIANFEYKDGYFALIEAYSGARIYHSFDVFDLEPVLEKQSSLMADFMTELDQRKTKPKPKHPYFVSVPITRMGTR